MDVEKPRANFDILNWWKINPTKFSILTQIARDVLAIPITMVASLAHFWKACVGLFSEFIRSFSEGVCWTHFGVHWLQE
jgi:hypothetical protein